MSCFMALATVNSSHVWLGLCTVWVSCFPRGSSINKQPIWIDFLDGLVSKEIGEGIDADQPPLTPYHSLENWRDKEEGALPPPSYGWGRCGVRLDGRCCSIPVAAPQGCKETPSKARRFASGRSQESLCSTMTVLLEGIASCCCLSYCSKLRLLKSCILLTISTCFSPSPHHRMRLLWPIYYMGWISLIQKWGNLPLHTSSLTDMSLLRRLMVKKERSVMCIYTAFYSRPAAKHYCMAVQVHPVKTEDNGKCFCRCR